MIPTLLALKDNRFIEFVGPLFVLANIIVIFVVNNIAEDTTSDSSTASSSSMAPERSGTDFSEDPPLSF